jgi:AdoMet-dependent rRNA methyltransferase SPB1
MPKWFAEDERRFMQPAPQISAEEFREAKDQLNAIDARPIKKVAEAKARKRNRLVARLQQARQRAEAVAAQEDMPSGAKMREIEKLYAAARSGSKGKKGAKGGKTKKLPRGAEYGKKRGPPLDSRLRKDRKGMERAAARIKGKGKGGAAGKKGRSN